MPLLTIELARLATALLEKETDPEKRWQRLCEVHRQLSQLRREMQELFTNRAGPIHAAARHSLLVIRCLSS
jgi:hypothetical protein